MKAAVYHRHGNPADVLSVEDQDPGQPAAGQVLISLVASPINPSDLLQISGHYGTLPPLPATPGSEGVGRIEALGEGVTGIQMGQTVLLPKGNGTWRSHMLAPAQGLMALPASNAEQLAMLTVNPPTAALLLDSFAKLSPGDWVIQDAANSGVGLYVAQLAKARGLKTVNVVRREEAAAAVREAGGDVVLVDGPDLARQVAEATGKASIKLGLDSVGGEASQRLGDCLGQDATMVVYGSMTGEATRLSSQALVFKGVKLQGFWLSRWYQQSDAAARGKVFGELVGLIAQGKLKSRIDQRFPLSRIQDAVRAAATGSRDGKILIVAD